MSSIICVCFIDSYGRYVLGHYRFCGKKFGIENISKFTMLLKASRRLAIRAINKHAVYRHFSSAPESLLKTRLVCFRSKLIDE